MYAFKVNGYTCSVHNSNRTMNIKRLPVRVVGR